MKPFNMDDRERFRPQVREVLLAQRWPNRPHLRFRLMIVLTRLLPLALVHFLPRRSLLAASSRFVTACDP